MKTCSKCKIEKDESEFSKNINFVDGLQKVCRICCKEIKEKNKDKYREQNKIYKELNKDKIKECKRLYREKNKDNIKAYMNMYRDKNKEAIKHKTKEYITKNIDKVKERKVAYNNKNRKELIKYRMQYKNKKLATDFMFKLKFNISNLIRTSLKTKGCSKKTQTSILLKCTALEFQSWLGQKPEGNYHLDHICPCSQAQNEEELIKLQHYSNFRWLKAEDNWIKSDFKTAEAEQNCRKLLGREWI
jgi:hypothetical protein